MQRRAIVNVADVHAGPLANGLQTLEDGDVAGVVVRRLRRRLLRLCRQLRVLFDAFRSLAVLERLSGDRGGVGDNRRAIGTGHEPAYRTREPSFLITIYARIFKTIAP